MTQADLAKYTTLNIQTRFKSKIQIGNRCGEQQEENGCFNSLLILVYKTMDPLG